MLCKYNNKINNNILLKSSEKVRKSSEKVRKSSEKVRKSSDKFG